jgi:pilus assembly protein Flp/PilA
MQVLNLIAYSMKASYAFRVSFGGRRKLPTDVVRTSRFALLPEAERANGNRLMIAFVTSLFKREDGPTAVEYAVMPALIIVVCIAVITVLVENANATFTSVFTAPYWPTW